VDAARRQGLDYKAVADKSKLPRPTVHRFFKGKSDMTSRRLDRLLGILGLCVVAKPKSILDD
jgi:hypothetical protein